MNGKVTTRAPLLTFNRTYPTVCRTVLCACLAAAVSHAPLALGQAKPAPHPTAPALNNRANQLQHSAPQPAQHGASANNSGKNQQHLSQWMESHRNLPLSQQQSALEAEPGFHQLQPQEQQRMRNQLTRLNSMPPQQQQRAIARTEWMEHLEPQQRQQVRNAMAQLGSLPPERAHAVGRAFRSLQNSPEPQRQAYLSSPQAHAEFNDQERGTLNNLLNVAPLIPPPVPTTPR